MAGRPLDDEVYPFPSEPTAVGQAQNQRTPTCASVWCDHPDMTWEWVAPVAGAAVGLAGIVAGWLTAHASRTDQRNLILAQQQHATEMALREMRQKAYANFIGNVYSVTAATATVDDQAAHDRAIAAVHDLARSLAEVRILGSDVIGELAGQVTRDTISFQVKSIEAKQQGTNVDKQAGKELGDKRSRLERLMAADLGVPSGLPEKAPN